MINEVQRSGAAPGIQRLGHLMILEKLQMDVESRKPVNINAIKNYKEKEKVLMEVGGVKT